MLNLWNTFWKFPAINAWWAQVTEIPEESKIIVFKRGTEKQLKVKIPIGGHTPPKSIAGANLLWKKAQKKEIKKKISETINRINPIRNPNSTTLVWRPLKVLSLAIFFHHIADTKINKKKPIIKRSNLPEENHFKKPLVK